MRHNNPEATRIDKTNLVYVIGWDYKYYNSDNIFRLKEVIHEGTIFRFECGHWCTDNVFIDLIPIKPIQLNLFP